jgi:hypothetical protein
MTQQNPAVRAFEFRIGIGEVFTYVAQCRRTE